HEATDGQLLEQFARRGDPDAFTTLICRHGPMVLGICLRILRDEHEAEDAFQATFLVLVRKASGIRRPELLANWLYGVALRTAGNGRGRAARRRPRESSSPAAPIAPLSQFMAWDDLGEVLDEKVSRLPEKYRLPFVLFYFRGSNRAGAARHLGCPTGTIKSR